MLAVVPLTPPELCLVASENWRKEQEKKKACAPSLKDVSTCLFLFLWQYRIILSADTANEVRQLRYNINKILPL